MFRSPVRIGIPLFQRRIIQRRQFSFDYHAVISSMTETVQLAHTYTGIPWWALIPLTTFTLRTVWTMPLAVWQRKRIQKQSELKPIISATTPVVKLSLAKKAQAAKRQADKDENIISPLQSPLASMTYEQILILSSKETRKRQKLLFKKHNVEIWKNFILPAFQIPLWIAMSLTFRDLSGWTTWDNIKNKALDPSLYEEGILWFQDLSVADNIHVFPLILGVITLCNVEWTFKTLELSRLTPRNKLRPTLTSSIANVARMSIVFMMAISLHAPVALTLYWLSSQVYSLIQNVILDLTMPISFTPIKRLNWPKSKSSDAIDIINK
ncbi:Mitochondrial inner membrane protein COX18 [Spathaspora sp. JA1]|nr:Mitochondrial inner membrane protein COX18 [Spathaspora sp. JA1]